jgi:hypothetical protein
MISTVSELIWIKQLSKYMKITCKESMHMYCGNQAVRHIASNPVFYERTKYVEKDCHFVQEKVQSDLIEMLSVSSQEQLVDILTKALDK